VSRGWPAQPAPGEGAAIIPAELLGRGLRGGASNWTWSADLERE